jgi:hypothetical protein
MKIYVKIPEDVDDGWMKGEPKSRKQDIAKDDNLIIAGLRHNLSAKGSRGPDHAVLSIRLRPKVYVFGISFATASRLRFEAMTALYCEAEEERRGEENLTVKPSKFEPLVCGSSQKSALPPDNLASNT